MSPSCIHPIRVEFGVPVSSELTLKRFAYVYVTVGEPVCLVDTGVAGAEETIGAVLREMGKGLEDVGTIVLTHSHPDHIGAASAIQGVSGARIWAHRGEQAWIEDTARQARERPVPGFAGLVGGPVRVDRFLAEGETVPLGDAGDFTVWHTPGHSVGSISLVSADARTVFCGDVIPQPGGMPIYEDVISLAQSLARLAELRDLHTLYSAWDEPLAGALAMAAISDGMKYLGTVHQIVQEAGSDDPVELCRRCVPALGLPPAAVNPLVARSLLAHRQPGVQDALESILGGCSDG